MNFEFESVLQYFDIAIITTIAGGAVFGFLKGTFKSAYNLLVFVGLLVAGWLLSPIFVRFLMDYDISEIWKVTIKSVEITSINDSIPALADALYPKLAGLVTPGSIAYLTLQAFVFMVLRIVVMILWFVLMGTVFKFIFWIIYRIIRPKSRNRYGKKIRPGMLSRLGGLALGAAHSLTFILLFSIPLSGLTSIGNSLVEMLPETDEDYLLVNTSEGSALQESIPSLEGFEDIFRFMASYRETVPGQIAGMVQIDGAALDEYLFDELFSLKIEKLDLQVKLKSELQTALRAYVLLTENIDGEISIETLAALDEEVLQEFASEIKKLKLLRVALPLGVEYARHEGKIDFLTEEEYEEAFAGLLEIDFGSELGNLVKAFSKAAELGLFSGESGTEFYLNLDGDQVEALFSDLSNLRKVDLLAGIAVGYYFGQEDVQKFFENYGIDPATLKMDNITWSAELANLGTLYKAFRELGLTIENGKPVLSALTDDGINSFSTAVFNSRLFADNGAAFGKILVNLLPEDYRSFFTVETFEKEDLVSLLSLAKVMADAGLLDGGDNFENLFLEENIERIAEAISKSRLLSSNISKLLKFLLEEAKLPFEMSETTLERDWSGEAGKAEIKALFSAAGELFDLGVSEGNFFENLTSEKIDELADKIAASGVLMANMGNLIDYLFSEENSLGNIRIDTTSVQNLDWESQTGRDEFKYIMKGFAALVEGKLHENPDIASLGDGTEDSNGDGIIDEKDNLIGRLAESFSGSILIRNNLSHIINEITSGQTGDVQIETFDNPDDWTKLEIESLLLSVKIISGKEKIPEDLFNLSDSELDTVLGSLLISRSIVKNLKEMTAPGGQLEGHLITEYVSDEDWYDRYDDGERVFDGELRRLFVSGKILLGENLDFENTENLVSLNRVLSISDEEIDKIVASTVLKDSFANKLIEIGRGETAEIEVNLAMNDPAWGGEIKNLIKAVKILLGDEADLDNISIDINTVKQLNDEDIDSILASLIISDTVIKKLTDIGKDPNGGLVVRFDKTDPAWRGSEDNPGELKNFLTAANRLLGEEDDLNSPEVISVSRIAQLTEEEIDLLSNSYLIVDTAVKHLRDMTAPAGSLHQVLYLPALTDDDYYGSAGEFKRFMLAIDILLEANGAQEELESLEKISLASLSGSNREQVLASEIVKETIIRNIEIEAEKPGSVIKIAPELDRSAPDYDKTVWDAELPKLLDAIIVILGDNAYLDEISVGENDFLALSDGEIATIVASRLVSYTAVKTIEANAKDSDSLIALPADLDPDSPEYDGAQWYGTDGELAKTLRALRELGLASFESDIRLQAVFSEARGETEEVILASRVLEASIVNKIEKEADASLAGILVIPEGVVWEKTESDKGELRRFLVAIEIIIGDNEFDSARFEVDRFLGDDQDTLLESKVVEASAIYYIKQSDKLIIPDPIQIDIYYYFADESLIWEGEEGELRRFLNGIKTLLGTGTFADFVFSMDNLMEADFEEALKSRVLEATLADMVLKMVSEGGALHRMIKEPDNGYQWYHHAGSTDPGAGAIRRGEYELNGNPQYSDLSGFLKAIQALSDAGLEYNNITKETIADADTDLLAAAFCDYSRIISGSIPTLLNYALKDVDHPFKPVFEDDDIDPQDKDSVRDALNLFSYFVKNVL